MLIVAVRTVRRALTGVWLLVLVGLIGLAALTHLASTFVIRGGSMEPGIPLGSLIVVAPVAAEAVQVGDVITIRADNGVVVTHRVTRAVELKGERYFEMKGDANPQPDPVLVPARAVVGRVATHLAWVGYFAVMLGTPSGLFSLLAFLGAGMLAIWFTEELEDDLAEVEEKRGAAALKGSHRGAVA